MAQSTRDIKRRIKSITSILQITSAMEIVSSSKLMKARQRLIRTRPYYYTVIKDMHRTFKIVGTKHPLLKKRDKGQTLYIVMSGDRGLAGGYNNNVVNIVEKDTKSIEGDSSLILIGTKAIDYFKRRNYKIRHEFTGISENPKYSDAEKIGKLALELYKNFEVSEIKIVYTRYINNITHETELINLLPVVDYWDVEDRRNEVVEFEPSPEKVLDYLIPKYINSRIYGALIESSCSEQSSRKLAMEVASENAREMIEELRNTYNKARQNAITTELNEIITSVEALRE